ACATPACARSTRATRPCGTATAWNSARQLRLLPAWKYRLRAPARRSPWWKFKGAARDYVAGDRAGVAWSYPSPSVGYEAIAGHFAFYPGRVDRATVDGEQVEAQPGDFYGGWVTPR